MGVGPALPAAPVAAAGAVAPVAAAAPVAPVPDAAGAVTALKKTVIEKAGRSAALAR